MKVHLIFKTKQNKTNNSPAVQEVLVERDLWRSLIHTNVKAAHNLLLVVFATTENALALPIFLTIPQVA